SYSFVIDEWFNNKNEHEYVYNNKINCYRFEVKTGSIDGAGTQKKLELGLVGANGESSLIYANSYAVDGVYNDAVKDATKIPFQKGKTETFIIPFKEDIGKLQAFAACCDYACWGDGNWIEPRKNDSWFCEYATVTNVDDVTDKISVSTNSWFRGSEKWVYEKDDLRYLVRIKMDKSGKRGENDNGYLFYIGAISDNPDWQYESLFSTDYDDTFVYDSVKKEYTVVTRLSEDALNALNDIDQIRIGIRYSWINVYEVTFQQYNNGAGLGPEIKFTGPGKKLEAYYYNAQPHDTLTRPGASIVGSIFGGSNIWIMIAIAVILIGGGVATVIILKKKKATAVVEMSEEQTEE
ncbi:MAG: PLAT/LH2 domain-containing protein, partial [Oscillospiraceae bacterium]